MVSTQLKHMSQIGSFSQVGVNIKYVWNHLVTYRLTKLIFTFPIFPQLGWLSSTAKIPTVSGAPSANSAGLKCDHRRDRNQDTQRNGDFIDINVKDLLISVEVFMVFILHLAILHSYTHSLQFLNTTQTHPAQGYKKKHILVIEGLHLGVGGNLI